MGDRVDFPVRDYQRDAVGQIERLADYLNAVDAAQPNEDGSMPLPCDIAIELLKQLGPLMPELSRRAREAEAERDRLQGDYDALMLQLAQTEAKSGDIDAAKLWRALDIAASVIRRARELTVTGKGGNPDEWPEDLRVREWPRRAA